MAIERRSEDARLAAVRNGAVASVIGWVFLLMAMFCGILVFQTYKHGTPLWRYMVYAMGLIGVILVFVGSRMKRANS